MAIKYLRQGASGSANGNDWTNAYTTTAALIAGLSRGDTAYIADGAYSADAFDTAASGTTVITIKKATAADHGTETGWDSTYGDGQAVFDATIQFSTNWWVFSGNDSPGGPHGCGIKILNDNEQLYTVRISGPDNIIVQFIEMDGTGSTATGQGVAIFSDSENITVSRCFIHDTPDDPITIADGCDNFVVEYNHIGPRGDSGGTHGDCIAMTRTVGGIIRFNTIVWDGQLCWWGEGPHSGTYEIYGNIFRSDQATPAGSCTVLKGHATATPEIILFYNNTVYHVNDFANEMGTGASEFKNNLFWDLTNGTISYGSKTHTHNWYETGMSFGTEATAQTSGTIPFTNAPSNFSLVSNTTAGADLGVSYDEDMNGVARSTWTRGALEFGSGAPTANISFTGTLTVTTLTVG